MLNSTKLWFALIAGPPVIHVIYVVLSLIPSYNGRCDGLLHAVGRECTIYQFVFSELTSTFFLPFLVFITLSWVAVVGVIYFGVRIFKSHFRKGTAT